MTTQSVSRAAGAEAPACFTEYTDGTPIPGTPAPQPCPFCGSLEVSIDGRGDGFGYFVECSDGYCHAQGPLCDSPLEAAVRWNAAAGSPGE